MTQPPKVKEIELPKRYDLYIEECIVPFRNELYVILSKENDLIDALKFDFSVYKYGYPNEEAAHPLVVLSGFHEVHNSPWIQELLENNRQHPGHQDSWYDNHRHYVIRYKDNTLDVISRGSFELVQIEKSHLMDLVSRHIDYMEGQVHM